MIFEDDCVFQNDFDKTYSYFVSHKFEEHQTETIMYFGERFTEKFKTNTELLERNRERVPDSEYYMCKFQKFEIKGPRL